jgi:hypothetical protein
MNGIDFDLDFGFDFDLNSATTHTDLILRAREKNIKVEVI